LTKKLLLEEFLDGPLEEFNPEKTMRGRNHQEIRASSQLIEKSQKAA
jgi:hypothetical protein